MKDVYEALSFMIEEEEPVSVIVRALNNAFFITHDEDYINNMNNEMMFEDISSECLYWKNCRRHSHLIENVINLLKNGTLIKDIHIRDKKDEQIVIDPNKITSDEIEEYNYSLHMFKETKDESYLKNAMEIIYYKDPISCHILKAYLNSFNNVFKYLIENNDVNKSHKMIERFLFYVSRDNNKEVSKEELDSYLTNLLKLNYDKEIILNVFNNL